jgi:hypothetical protein
VRSTLGDLTAGSSLPDAYNWDPFSCSWDQGLKRFAADESMDGYMTQCHRGDNLIVVVHMARCCQEKDRKVDLPRASFQTGFQMLVVDGPDSETKAH